MLPLHSVHCIQSLEHMTTSRHFIIVIFVCWFFSEFISKFHKIFIHPWLKFVDLMKCGSFENSTNKSLLWIYEISVSLGFKIPACDRIKPEQNFEKCKGKTIINRAYRSAITTSAWTPMVSALFRIRTDNILNIETESNRLKRLKKSRPK